MYLEKVLGIGSSGLNPFLACADSEMRTMSERYAVTDGFSFVSLYEPLHNKPNKMKIMKAENGYEGRIVASIGIDSEILVELNMTEREDLTTNIKSLFRMAFRNRNGKEILAAIERASGLIDEGKESALGLLKEGMEYVTYISPEEGFIYMSTEEKFPKTADITGETAEKIADRLYEWMDERFVVFTAAALWMPFEKSWRLAVRNRY